MRAILSSLLIIVFVVVAFTGIGLYFAPADPVGWSFFGLKKMQLEKLHTVSGFVMIGLIIVHLSLNFKMFIGELKSLKRRPTSNK